MQPGQDQASGAGRGRGGDPGSAPESGTEGPSGSATLPSVSLPKGGGAIRGLGEKFAANPVTGTGSMLVPIPASPGRQGFGPQLSLSYDSGSGNGPFGFGWRLSLPAITRRTEKGLPLYRDGEESDAFVLSGAEDLVPLLAEDESRWADATEPGYVIHRYLPRVEGSFIRLERWTRLADGDVHWRSFSRDNTLSVYGADARSRITDPADPGRIFSWLICESRDERGNVVLHEYKAEDGAGVDLTRISERNRGPADDVRRTANRYPKRIRYGNVRSLLDPDGRRPRVLDPDRIATAQWLFEVVFDYGEHDDGGHDDAVPSAQEVRPWALRIDPFSAYRSGFEVRTARRCSRILVFHHFPDEPGVGADCLVRSTDLTYDERDTGQGPTYSFLTAATQVGYVRAGAGYTRRPAPAVEFGYSRPVVQDEVRDVDPDALGALARGPAGSSFSWVDLHGEGLPGVLTSQGGAWRYTRNLSPLQAEGVRLGPTELVAVAPSSAGSPDAEVMDLAGDGLPDLVTTRGPVPGFFEHDDDEGWGPFRPFRSLPGRALDDPDLRFVDLNGDGHADLLVTEEDRFLWYPSLAEDGFGRALSVAHPLDEQDGPRGVFGDGTGTLRLADLSGDGLLDLVRIRNGEICYWPNLGHGRFGPRITMDASPVLDDADQFDPARVRLADIDGTGTTDLVYLHRDGVRLYFNLSGNGWTVARQLAAAPAVPAVVDVAVADLLGNGTACLVWSSPLPGDAGSPVRYVDLMGGVKPHLMVYSKNNLGAETHVEYASSVVFYLRDRRAGRPWATRLPFPVHVVERVVTVDRISRNRFVTRFAYHHGDYDGEEREFRGFAMVEQWDTEQLGARGDATTSNVAAESHVPPVLTRTWFHTGAQGKGEDRSGRGLGLSGEFFREPGLSAEQAAERLLDEPPLPGGLTPDERREAVRALKGRVLREEIYGLDGSDREPYPYLVAHRSYEVRLVQPRASARHAVFFVHPRESLTYTYEREPADPRIRHDLVLEVDRYGLVRRETAVAYGRRHPDPRLPSDQDREVQGRHLVTYAESDVAGEAGGGAIDSPTDYRTPLPSQARVFELTGALPDTAAGRFSLAHLDAVAGVAAVLPFEAEASHRRPEKRLVDSVRVLYRTDDLAGPLPLGRLQALAMPYESYRLALTPGLVAGVFAEGGVSLLPDDARGLGRGGGEGAGYVDLDSDGNWWVPSGRFSYSASASDTPEAEVAHARAHFFLPHRRRDAFHTQQVPTESVVSYDRYDLLVIDEADALGNRTTVGRRRSDDTIDPGVSGHDYRVLRPAIITDPNGNRTDLAYDALGLLAAIAVRGKPGDDLGDRLDGLVADLPEATLLAHLRDPLGDPHAVVGHATCRFLYDHFAYARTAADAQPQPPVSCELKRDVHEVDLASGETSTLGVQFVYGDGFGREIQKKVPAEPVQDQGGGATVPRWAGTGWVIYDNKGQRVREYEPFFTTTHLFEFDLRAGVSAVRFYDPIRRLVGALHPDHRWEKIVFGAWRHTSWDVNDTVLIDVRSDPDIGPYASRLPAEDCVPSWSDLRTGDAHAAELAARYPDAEDREGERRAARQTAVHGGTATVSHVDPLGRVVLAITHNRWVPQSGDVVDEFLEARTVVDIEGNELAERDGAGRLVVRRAHDVLGNVIRNESLDAGERRMLADSSGAPFFASDSRGHRFRTAYDPLRRPVESFVTGPDGVELLVGRTRHGEDLPGAAAANTRGRVVEIRDQSGVSVTDRYDVKGNPVRTVQYIAREYRDVLDWSGDVALDGPGWVTALRFDARNRPTMWVAPHSDGSPVSVVQPRYNAAGLLERIDAWLDQPGVPERPLDPATATDPAVTGVTYDAKGRRTSIDYGNSVTTNHSYDRLTSRLTRLQTIRTGTLGGPAGHVQDLHYTYDPVGNVTRIRDTAQQAVFFRNARVAPGSDYVYDALYRLVEATGREHLGQIAGTVDGPVPHAPGDPRRTGLPHPQDGRSMGRYVEQYRYDAVGNILQMRHRGSDPAHPGWRRSYTYEEPSRLEPDRPGNRLTKTAVGATTEVYSQAGGGYDAHGSMLNMPHLTALLWDFHDQLHMTGRQRVRPDADATATADTADTDTAGGGTRGEVTWYVYDSTGRRVRKVTEHAGGGIKDERLDLGGVEVYRRHGVHPLTRETLHITDRAERIALVETRTEGDEPGVPRRLTRFQLADHRGSAVLELDGSARIVSYEEYSPYGSTTYQAVRALIETPKRYRHRGERDDETGLDYVRARYYAPWLGRWTSADPAGIRDGPNVYRYVDDNPVYYTDGSGTETDEQKATRLFKEFLEAEGVRFHQEVPFRVQVNGQWVEGRADFFVEKGPGHWEPVEMKGKATSRWTEAQMKYLPALQQGAKFETLNSRSFHGTPYKGAGGGKVMHVNSVVAGMVDFKKLITTTYYRRPQGDVLRQEKISITRDRGNNVVSRVSEPHVKTLHTPDVPHAPKGMKGGGTVGKLVNVAIAIGVFAYTGDAWAAVQTANPFADTTDALLADDISAGDTAKGLGMDVVNLTPLGLGVTVYEVVKPRGENIYDADLAERALQEGRNPFCAQCHGPGGALDPNNNWNRENTAGGLNLPGGGFSSDFLQQPGAGLDPAQLKTLQDWVDAVPR